MICAHHTSLSAGPILFFKQEIGFMRVCPYDPNALPPFFILCSFFLLSDDGENSLIWLHA